MYILLKEKRAYEVLQDQVEKSFAADLHIRPQDIKNIVIVGAWHGLEISRLLENYINAFIFAFEPYPGNFNVLNETYGKIDRVRTYCKAVADRVDCVKLYELSKAGNASILLPADPVKEELNVDCTTLIHEFGSIEIDLLWIDTQGAELHVLQGANIKKCKSMFIEVYTKKNEEHYKGQCYLDDLIEYLKDTHELTKLGLDNEYNNGIGNSFWIRKDLIRNYTINPI